jgi:hypothetical protein
VSSWLQQLPTIFQDRLSAQTPEVGLVEDVIDDTRAEISPK